MRKYDVTGVLCCILGMHRTDILSSCRNWLELKQVPARTETDFVGRLINGTADHGTAKLTYHLFLFV